MPSPSRNCLLIHGQEDLTYNIAIGLNAGSLITSQHHCILIGANTQSAYNHCIVIGNDLQSSQDYELVIGNERVRTSRVMTEREFSALYEAFAVVMRKFFWGPPLDEFHSETQRKMPTPDEVAERLVDLELVNFMEIGAKREHRAAEYQRLRAFLISLAPEAVEPDFKPKLTHCPHAAPFIYCESCKADPCPLGLKKEGRRGC